LSLIFHDSNNKVYLVHNDPGILSAEEKIGGIEVDSIPEPEYISRKAEVLYINPDTKDMYYEYVDIPLNDAEKIQQLESELAISKEDNVSNMLAITELYEMILGGIA
jgi:hypothetical protein